MLAVITVENMYEFFSRNKEIMHHQTAQYIFQSLTLFLDGTSLINVKNMFFPPQDEMNFELKF